MYKNIRRRFIFITMLVLTSLLFIIFLTINAIHIAQNTNYAKAMNSWLSAYEGVIPRSSLWRDIWGEEVRYTTRYFAVRATEQNEILMINTNNIAAVNPEEARSMALSDLNNNASHGLNSNYYYQITRDKNSGLKLILYLDVNSQIESIRNLVFLSSIVFLGFLLLSFILISFFSKWAIKPFIANEEKQKRFINDASHELKTPITIIQSNLDILKLEKVESDWLDSIQKQNRRMKLLVDNLLRLNQYQEIKNIKKINTTLELIISNCLNDFHGVFQAKEMHTYWNPNESYPIFADEKILSDLFSILLMNVSQYASDGGILKIDVSRMKNNYEISLSNTSEPISDYDLAHLFERFYRADSSRVRANEHNGSGIGLSIAKELVDVHNGEISANYNEDMFEIKISLPIA